MDITIKDIEENLKTLPEELFRNVNDYIEFLKTRYQRNTDSDWAEFLSEPQRESIAKGISDIENGNVITHEEAKKRIKEYIEKRTK